MELVFSNRNQNTLKGPFSVTGRGFWTGRVNTLTFLPAAAGVGIRFYRRDLLDNVGTQAVSEHCQGLSLRTCLAEGHRKFEMIEHVMAALAGMNVDNCHVWCTDAEMPGMDGSSYAFASAIAQVGTVELPAPRLSLVVNSSIRFGSDNQWVGIEPCDSTFVEYQLDYGPGSPIGSSTFGTEIVPDRFYHELSAARTFVMQDEARALQARGLARHVSERDLLVFDSTGPVNNSLRFPNECARHKALDIVGDLAVVGVDLIGKIVGYRSGHQQNAQLARALRGIVQALTEDSPEILVESKAA